MTELHAADDRVVLGQNQQPQWTQEEAINYECAREVITDLMAIQTSQIYDESGKPHPDAVRIESLRAERSRLFRERADLHVRDHDKIARIRAEYGSRVRSWCAGNQVMAGKSAWH